MVVDLVLGAFLANLVKTVKLVKVHAVTVRHDEPVEDNGHAPLLADTRGSDLFGFAQNNRSVGDEDMLTVMRIERIRDKNFHPAYGVPIQAIHQDCVKDGSLIYEIGLTRCGIDIRLDGSLVALISLRLLTG